MFPALVSVAFMGVVRAADDVSTSDDASARLSWVIWGLLVLAVVIAVATAAFWWVTRPGREEAGSGIRWVGDPGSPGGSSGTDGPDDTTSGPVGSQDPGRAT